MQKISISQDLQGIFQPIPMPDVAIGAGKYKRGTVLPTYFDQQKTIFSLLILHSHHLSLLGFGAPTQKGRLNTSISSNIPNHVLFAFIHRVHLGEPTYA